MSPVVAGDRFGTGRQSAQMCERYMTNERIRLNPELGMVHRTMKHTELAVLRKECASGNDRACDTLERVCEGGREEACQYIP